MAKVKFIVAPEILGPLTLSVTVDEGGAVSGYIVYIAGRQYDVERLTETERAWVDGILAGYGVAE